MASARSAGVADGIDRATWGAVGAAQDQQQATERQKEQFVGVKVRSAFFGRLTATSRGVLLTALVAAADTFGRSSAAWPARTSAARSTRLPSSPTAADMARQGVS